MYSVSALQNIAIELLPINLGPQMLTSKEVSHESPLIRCTRYSMVLLSCGENGSPRLFIYVRKLDLLGL